MELWRELYEPFGVMVFTGGNTGTQMGGWFNREINSPEDLKDLKMRIPRLARYGRSRDAPDGACTQADWWAGRSLEEGLVLSLFVPRAFDFVQMVMEDDFLRVHAEAARHQTVRLAWTKARATAG